MWQITLLSFVAGDAA